MKRAIKRANSQKPKAAATKPRGEKPRGADALSAALDDVDVEEARGGAPHGRAWRAASGCDPSPDHRHCNHCCSVAMLLLHLSHGDGNAGHRALGSLCYRSTGSGVRAQRDRAGWGRGRGERTGLN